MKCLLKTKPLFFWWFFFFPVVFLRFALHIPAAPAAEDCANLTPIRAVAAENFYGNIVSQLGGDCVTVTSILHQPDQDPHLFEASPATARRLATAQLVVYNGAAYDLWITRLLDASPAPHRAQIVAAALVGKQAADNPHLWYSLATMRAVANAIHTFLIQHDPQNKPAYDAHLAAFLDSLKPIDAKIAALRAKYRGVPVSATEPVFDYMADAIGLKRYHRRFQRAMMNNTEPTAADIAAFENDLREQRVRVLIYNQQTANPIAHHLLSLARQSGIAVVYVTETQPAGESYQQWMLSQLDNLERGLNASTRPQAS